MATIGTITTVFDSDLSGLQRGTSDASSLLRGLVASVEQITDQLELASESTVAVRAAVDTSEVEDLGEEIERQAPTVHVHADASEAVAEASRASQALARMRETFTEIAAAEQPLSGISDTMRAVGGAATAAGDAIELSVSGGSWERSFEAAIVAAGRYRVALAAVGTVAASVAASTGGFTSVIQALRGDVTATRAVIASLGGSLSGLAAGAAVYAAAMGVARYATAGMNEEARGYVDSAVQAAAAGTALYASTRAAAIGLRAFREAAGDSGGIAGVVAGGFRRMGEQARATSGPIGDVAGVLGDLFAAIELVSVAADDRASLNTWIGTALRLGATSAVFGALTGAVYGLANGGMGPLAGAVSGASAAVERFVGILPSIAIYSAAAAVATGRVRHEMHHMAGEIVSIRNMADRFGMATQQVEELRYAASIAGVSMSQLAKGQQQFYSSLSKIRIGQINTENVREAKLAFDKLNISVATLKAEKPHEIFEMVAEALNKIEDPADRSAIAFDLFGKSGVNILPALKNIKRAKEEVERLDVTTNSLDFARGEEMAASFSRLERASASFGEAGLTGFLELTVGINNFLADVLGGFATLSQNSGSLFADMTEPLAQVIEVSGRVINILARMAAALMKVTAALSNFPIAARLVQVLGEYARQAMVPIEALADTLNEIAAITYDSMVPEYFSAVAKATSGAAEGAEGAAEGMSPLVKAIQEAAVNFAIGIASAAAFTIAMMPLAPLFGGLEARLWTLAQATWTWIRSLSVGSVIQGAVRLIRLLTIDLVQLAAQALLTSISYVAAMVRMEAGSGTRILLTIRRFVMLGATMVYTLVTTTAIAVGQFLLGMARMVLSVNMASIAMAASWVVATLGIGLLLLAAYEIYNNFDALTDYFSNWQENLAKLFTFDGMREAIKGIADYFKGMFVGAVNATIGFFGGMAGRIAALWGGIEEPKAIDSAKASAEDIAKSRQEYADVAAKKQRAINDAGSQIGAVFGFEYESEPIKRFVEDQEEVKAAVGRSRDSMDELFVESGKFGDKAEEASQRALKEFNNLQEEFRKSPETGSPMSLEEFEKRAQKIAEETRENFTLFSDEDAATALKKNREFFKSLNSSVKDFAKSAREVSSGTIVEGQFFPTSQAIKEELARVQDEYEKAVADIQRKKQKGQFGSGEAGDENAAIAVEEAQRAQKRSMDAIGRDTGFADEIRKKLETAFLSGPEKLEKELEKIADNKSLNKVEAALAAQSAKKEYAEGLFGTSVGSEFKDKSNSVQFLDQSRQRGASLSLAAEGRSALGLDEDLGNTMAIGVEKINDMFGQAGKSVNDARAALAGMPGDLALYDEAIAKNREKVLQSVGVEKSGIEKLKELNQKLAAVGATQTETDEAMRKATEGFVSSLGVTKTPLEDFQIASSNIAEQFGMAGLSLDQVRIRLNGNAAQLGLFERAVKAANEGLLASVGIEKTPAVEFAEMMKKITEAGGNLTAEQKQLAESTAKRKRDEALGAGETSANFKARFDDQQKRLEEAYGKDGKNAPEEFAAGMRALMKTLPGGQDSPLVKFREDLAKLNASGIGGREYAERKTSLQAELQDSLMPALQSVMPDRRQAEGADTRSKAGVDTFFRILRGNDNPSLKAQLQVVRNTRELVEATKDKNAAPVIAQLGRR
jgi:hypothetical protein